MDEQQGGRWNTGKEKKRGRETESYNFSFFVKTKAKTFCLQADTWAHSLINPMCSCLWGVKSEGSCPMWPQGSAELCGADDPRDLTVLSHKITCCIYSGSWNSKYKRTVLHKMLAFIVPWIRMCIFSVCVSVCQDACHENAEGHSLSDWYSSTAYHQGFSEMGW